jgi:hypothetical protein
MIAGKSPGPRTVVEQALDIWPVLVKCAIVNGSHADEAKITYGDLARAIGYPRKKAGRSLGEALELIGWYCRARGAPILSSLVVKQSTKEIGKSVVLNKGLVPEQERANVVNFDWESIHSPNLLELQSIELHSRAKQGTYPRLCRARSVREGGH